jgi:hypothetical protein
VKEAGSSPAATWFTITAGAEPNGFRVAPGDGGVFINSDESPLADAHELTSGDLIRVGHYTFRFQRVRAGVAVARRADAMATFAKIILALVFVAELVLVYWLPRRLQESRLLAVNVLRHKAVRELDTLRATAKLGGEAPAGSLPALARAAVAEELDELTLYVRQSEKTLSGEQWQQIRTSLSSLNALVEQADSGEIGPPLPELDINRAVIKVLENHNADIPTGRSEP